MKIALTSVFVNDPLEAFRFYTETLGFVEKMYMPEHYLAIVASPEDPDGTSLLLEPNLNLGAKEFQKGIYDAGLPIIVFGVPDVQAEYERLRGRGVAFRKEPTKTDWGIEAVFDDTCGNYIQIAQQ
ncbi:MAG TPA: VOC family protein [Longimicrobiaceae bacterium]|nr:VOC family protein [Longimicrobiaceae bacterium]